MTWSRDHESAGCCSGSATTELPTLSVSHIDWDGGGAQTLTGVILVVASKWLDDDDAAADGGVVTRELLLTGTGGGAGARERIEGAAEGRGAICAGGEGRRATLESSTAGVAFAEAAAAPVGAAALLLVAECMTIVDVGAFGVCCVTGTAGIVTNCTRGPKEKTELEPETGRALVAASL